MVVNEEETKAYRLQNKQNHIYMEPQTMPL